MNNHTIITDIHQNVLDIRMEADSRNRMVSETCTRTPSNDHLL